MRHLNQVLIRIANVNRNDRPTCAILRDGIEYNVDGAGSRMCDDVCRGCVGKKRGSAVPTAGVRVVNQSACSAAIERRLILLWPNLMLVRTSIPFAAWVTPRAIPKTYPYHWPETSTSSTLSTLWSMASTTITEHLLVDYQLSRWQLAATQAATDGRLPDILISIAMAD